MGEGTPDFGKLLRDRPTSRPSRTARSDGRTRSGGFAFAAAVVAGGLVVIGGYLAAGGGSSAPVTTTTTTAAPIEASVFPEGYVDVNDVAAVRAERALFRDGKVYVTLSTAVRLGLDPARSTGFAGGRWELVLGGDRVVQAEAEIIAGHAPGVLTVVFPATGDDAGNLVSLRLTALAMRSSAEVVQTIELDALPYRSSGDEVLSLDTGVALRVEEVSLRPDGGELRWVLDAGEGVSAVVTATVTIRESFNDLSPGVMLPTWLGRRFVSVLDEPATSGSIPLTPPSLAQTVSLLAADVVWEVTWGTFVPASAEVPLDGVAVGNAGG